MSLPPNDPFMLALSAYQARRLEEAERLCRDVLKSRPDHAACLHLLGVLEYGLGRAVEAEQLMRRSVAMKPGFAEIHFSFAQVLSSLEKYDEAIEQYQLALDAKPEHAEACFGLGNALKLTGRPKDAEEAYREALKLRPDYPEALNNLGVAAFERGDFAEAIRLHDRALALRPDYAAAFNNMGNVFKAQGKWKDAIICYKRALVLKPGLAQALNNLGLALLYGASDVAAAITCFEQILAQEPNNVPAWTHLGITLCLQGKFAHGLVCYEKALALDPNYFDALNNMGNALKALGKIPEAIDAYERVKLAHPDDPEIHNNLAMALLMDGRFDEGWQEYQWRWQTAQLAEARRDFQQPEWRGEQGQGGVLLIHAEQGFGDTLQFCRFAPLAVQKGWRVIVEAQREVVRLLMSLPGVEKVIARGDPLPAFDRHCPMMSLPVAFALQPDTIPADKIYLWPNEVGVKAWKARLATAQNKRRLKVGLAWTGNPRLFSLDMAAANARRSLPPEALAQLGCVPQVDFYSLQKECATKPAGIDLIDFMPECRDFADTAALVVHLDLILSVDTAVAHLAAALGKPVWLLNRRDTCWRWFKDREDSPWYPTLRILRQKSPGDWGPVIDRACRELEAHSKKLAQVET